MNKKFMVSTIGVILLGTLITMGVIIKDMKSDINDLVQYNNSNIIEIEALKKENAELRDYIEEDAYDNFLTRMFKQD